ncbi:MAG: type I restriction-modification system subunit M [Chloroflexi bacterium]|nr:type I restriction-modification system subunit M [Chloroflexota bacterium]
MGKNGKTLDTSTLENWLWDAACVIRGPLDAPKFKDYILPLIFLKRLSDVFEDEIEQLEHEFGDRKTAAHLADEDHGLVRFYIPEIARWKVILQKTTGLGEHLTDAVRAVARENPRLQGVIDVIDFNATAAGQPIVDNGRLVALVQVLSQHRLGLDDVEPDILGRAYEYLLRKFAEGQGQSAGEFYTPREVGILMARILEPEPGMEVYDPCCGSGGLLIKCHLRLLETHGQVGAGLKPASEAGLRPVGEGLQPTAVGAGLKPAPTGHRLPPHIAPLKVYGQEINPTVFAMARMNAFLHDMEAEIAVGDTMNRPAFTESDGRLKAFDLVTANPMWNQKFPTSTYEHDPYERFPFGIAPSSSADWGWIQHMYTSLRDGGRMAVVLDTGAVSRGSGSQGSNRERDIRKAFVDADRVEAVILLPENLFYNTTAPGIILVISKLKHRQGEIMLINASKLCAKGKPKNFLTDEHIGRITAIYHRWQSEEGISAIITTAEAVRNDYNLSPSRYVAQNGGEEVLPLEEAVVLLQEAEEERAAADRELERVLTMLGLKA